MTEEELSRMRSSARIQASDEVLVFLARAVGQLLPGALALLRAAESRHRAARQAIAFRDRDAAQSDLLAGEYQDALSAVWTLVISEATKASEEPPP